MTTQLSTPTEIECPLCLGAGKLKRTEVLDRLGVNDFARVAQLSAEEAFRLLQQKHHNDEQNVWARFESELAKRTAEIEQRHRDELRTLGSRIKELESAAHALEDRLQYVEVAGDRDRAFSCVSHQLVNVALGDSGLSWKPRWQRLPVSASGKK